MRLIGHFGQRSRQKQDITRYVGCRASRAELFGDAPVAI